MGAAPVTSGPSGAPAPSAAGSLRAKTWRKALRTLNLWIGALLVLAVVVFALCAPLIGPEGYDRQNLLTRLQAPSAEHPLGTDALGRDVLSRLAHGAGPTLQIGLIAVAFGAVFGTLLGLVAGFYGGRLDRFIMGVMDVLLAFPGIFLAIGIVAALGPGFYNVTIAVGINGIPIFARLVRGQVLSLREKEFVEAARSQGARTVRVMFQHVLPNATAPIIVMISLRLASSILSAAALSFLGLGVQAPLPEWGLMIDEGRRYLRSAWWIATFPGLGLMIVVIGFNLLSDGLRDLFDPRSAR